MTTSTAGRRSWSSRLAALTVGSCLAFAFAASAQAAAPTSSKLNAAARRSTQADHSLVSAANKLKSCKRENISKPSRCNAEQRAVEAAGRRLARAERRLAQLARGSGDAHSSTNAWALRAPVLRVVSQRLAWAPRPNISSYVLSRSVPGEPTQYSVIGATTTTPPPVPGVSVTYSVRTDVTSSAWSDSVEINYPALVTPPPSTPAAPPTSTPVSTTTTPVNTPTTPTTPPPTSGSTTPESPPPLEQVNTQAAPTIVVSGEKLSWNTIATVTAYVLASKVPGHPETFTEVTGTSITPPVVAGTTVHYSVRTAVDGSAWSSEVAIAYPAVVPPPPPPVKEVESASPGTHGFEPGVNAGFSFPIDVNGAVAVGAKVVRLEFAIGLHASALEADVAQYAAKGIRIAPLAGFYGTLPSAAEAKNLAEWTRVFGPGGSYWATHGNGQLAFQTIEFGNETSMGYQYGDSAGTASFKLRAETYALRLKEASEAISATGIKVGLLAQAEDWTGDWMNAMFSVVPKLGNYIAGWVSHPYGTGWHTKIEDIIKQAAAHGASASLPIDITEWGLASDNGPCLSENYGWNPCMTYQQAGETLRKNVAEIRSYLGSRQGLFLMYQVRDQQEPNFNTDRESYFGILGHLLAPKGLYTTAAEEVLAA
jgi:hypothetical protein